MSSRPGAPLPRERDPFAPVDAASLGAFRIGFGLLLLIEVWRYVQHGWITSIYIVPPFHFTWPGLGWIRPWPGAGMHVHFLVLAVAAGGVAAGVRYRLAATILALGWTYVFLLEQAVYLNHIYLVCLVAWLMAWVPADRALRIDGGRRLDDRPPTVPAWTLWLLRLQVGIPYFYGGLAKLNGDFLRGQPMQMWMSRMETLAWVPGMGSRELAVGASFAGALFDLLVVPALLWRRTRTAAFVLAILFHLANAVMWRIGIFPWMMIAATTLFLDPSWPRRFTRVGVASAGANAAPAPSHFRRRATLAVVAMWVAIQLLVPFRHLLVPGRVDWTEEGYRFSWRMMLNDKTTAIRLELHEPTTGLRGPVDPREYGLTRTQWDKLSQYPDLLVQFCRHVARERVAAGHPAVEVRAVVLASLNGRRPQYLVDPTVDLAIRTVQPLQHAPWLVPLVEPLPAEPFLRPQRTWEREVGGWAVWSATHLRE